MLRLKACIFKFKAYPRKLSTGTPRPCNPSGNKPEKSESDRIKTFHDKLKLEKLPRVKPAERFMELVLVNIDPNTGELIPDSEKNPTKWGDWQHHGRVTDF